MTDKTNPKTFTQDELNELVKSRLVREREKWEKESDAEVLRKALEAKEQELEGVRADHHREAAERAVTSHLESMGITEPGRQGRILRHVDLGEVSVDDTTTVRKSLSAVQADLPELFEGRRVAGAGSGGSSRPVLEQPEKPLTREEVEAMSPEEQNRPGMRERINRFLQGECG